MRGTPVAESTPFKSVVPDDAVPSSEADVSRLDTSVAHPARIYDYWLGGKDNYAADRAAGDLVLAARPGLRESVQANRAFLGRVVRLLVGELGIRQFLDIGTGIPSASNTHEVAQQVAPDARIVYTDNDPIVLAHARALLTSTEPGVTAYLDMDLRDTGKLLEQAAETLDFSQPIAIMLLGILHLISDEEDPWGIVARLVSAVPSGSYLVITHPASDLLPETQDEASRRYNQNVATHQTLRSYAEVARFFDGLDLLEPGLVQWHLWRPEPGDVANDDFKSGHCGVARKP
jgi:S-adenosyl methyltransferase